MMDSRSVRAVLKVMDPPIALRVLNKKVTQTINPGTVPKEQGYFLSSSV